MRGDALCGFGTVVFFDELQVDVGGGAIGVIEFGVIDAEEFEGLVEVGFSELGLQYNKLIKVVALLR